MDVHTMIVVYVPVGGKVNCTVGIRWRRIHRDANPHVHSPVKRIRVEGCGRRSVIAPCWNEKSFYISRRLSTSYLHPGRVDVYNVIGEAGISG